MNEQECLSKMVPPGKFRPGKMGNFGGVVQIWVTRMCDLSCYGCTQGSNLAGAKKEDNMTPEQFRQACRSLTGYFGVVGMFGGNPAIHPQFEELCEVMRDEVPFAQRGLWCNNPLGKGKAMAKTFNPAVCNLNVHLSRSAFDEFKRDWRDSRPFGLDKDSRHSPPYVAMKDVLKTPCPSCGGSGDDESGHGINPCHTCNGSGQVYDEAQGWDLISGCDINQHWSAMIGVFRGELRAWFCEIAGAQSMLHQHEPDYPDTGSPLSVYNNAGFPYPWWQMNMNYYAPQVRKHCHDCGVPLRGYGELAVSNQDAREQVSKTHKDLYKPKRKGRAVELVTVRSQLSEGKIQRSTDYLGNSGR